MKPFAVLLAVFALACGSSTAPKLNAGRDPSVRLTNQSPDVVRIIFASDQSGSLTIDTVPVAAGATACVTWTQTFDSLYTKVVDTLPNQSGRYSTAEFPWLKLGQYAYYFQDDTVFSSGGNIAAHVVAAECTP